MYKMPKFFFENKLGNLHIHNPKKAPLSILPIHQYSCEGVLKRMSINRYIAKKEKDSKNIQNH
jgi:hypothetical protein